MLQFASGLSNGRDSSHTGVGLKDLDLAVSAASGEELSIVGGRDAVDFALVGDNLLLGLGREERGHILHSIQEAVWLGIVDLHL